MSILNKMEPRRNTLLMNSLKIILIAFSLLKLTQVQAKPESLNTLFHPQSEVKKAKKGKKSKHTKTTEAKASLAVLPPEYAVYFEAKALLDSKNNPMVGKIEAIEKKMLSVKMSAETKVLEKEFEELFYAFEVRRAERYAKTKQWIPAMQSFSRALSGLHAHKLIYYWSETSSEALTKVCRPKPKKTDEACLQLAKKVSDAFPKNALETKSLKELPLPESQAVPITEGSAWDRLSQTYTEKTEKDEEAFTPVLQAFLKGNKNELLSEGKDFLQSFPKSIIRFRVLFLMAEAEFKAGSVKEAKEKYTQIMDEVPLSYYALVASERSGVSLRDRVIKTPLLVDVEELNFQESEKQSLSRALTLLEQKHFEEVAIELDTFSRVKSYSQQTLLYLMGLATQAEQNLSAFKFASELIQRRYDGLLQQGLLEMVFPDRYSSEIEKSAKQNKIDPLWVTSLMKQESGFKAAILSSSGALGLMQLMPFTAIDVQKNLYLKELKIPATNIAVGTEYLASLSEKYSGNMVYALAAYNAGPNRVAKWKKEADPKWGQVEFIESIPYKETRDYVMSILRNRYWYSWRKGLETQSVLKAGYENKKQSP